MKRKVELTIIYSKDKHKKLKIKHKVDRKIWEQPGFNRRNYCLGVCQVIGGKFIEYHV